MSLTKPEGYSPRWDSTTKLVVALTFVAIIAGLLVKFREFLAPLLLSFILAYLVYPLADRIRKHMRIPWRLTVGIIYLLIVILIIGASTWGGITIVEQLQSLIGFLQRAIAGLPAFFEDLSQRTFVIGPFQFDFKSLDLYSLSNQVLGVVQPIFSQAGTLLGGLASGAASVIGWMFFILWVSFFMVSETEGVPDQLIHLRLPGYSDDLKRMSLELGRIWNAFLRGQFIIVMITIVVYNILLGSLGVRFFFGLAIIAGLARFLPYVGPLIAWITYGLVTYFQGSTIFGLSPFVYVVLVVGLAWITDAILDNFMVPRVLADSMKVHPAAVMVAALMGYGLLGLVGIVLAAPVFATLKLLMDYATRKLFDQDPWEEMQMVSQPKSISELIAELMNLIKKGIAFLKLRR